MNLFSRIPKLLVLRILPTVTWLELERLVEHPPFNIIQLYNLLEILH